MSLSDYEIMGGIGYGGDTNFYGDPGDIKSLILNEQPFPTKEPTWKPVPFAAGAGLGFSAPRTPYAPINQEPMGRSYRPDQFGLSGSGQTYYKYPEWNPDGPVSGIKFERNTIAGSNSLAVEDYFQTETARFGDNVSVNKSMPLDGRSNAYDLITLQALKEHFTNNINDAAQLASNNYNILIIMLFIVFIVIATLQHRQIQKLQKIIGKAILHT
jgi:hypothetical protein